ncbi:Alpha N-terminal protein methyltransferase [Apiospora arundinis]|uniref:Uncharacterized protein n=1 Tax=Apiospora arundinis TaxID=335852 RepID=A0ABR2JJC2_9PEZI
MSEGSTGNDTGRGGRGENDGGSGAETAERSEGGVDRAKKQNQRGVKMDDSFLFRWLQSPVI